MRSRLRHICFLWIVLFLPTPLHAQGSKQKIRFEVSDHADPGRWIPDRPVVKDSLELTSYLGSVLSDLWRSGYIGASIDSTVPEGEFLTCYVHVGRQYEWAKISLNPEDEALLKDFSIGAERLLNGPLNPTELADIRERIIIACENNGYPFASVSLEDVHMAGSTVSARLNLQENESYTIDSIIIKGNARLRNRYLQKLIGISKGDPYRQNQLVQISRRIEETGFLSEIKPFELEFFPGQVDLYTYIDRKKANQFNGIAGFLPDHTKSGKLLVTGDIRLLLVNSFARGESFSLDWKKPEPLSQELHISAGYPFLFNTSLGTAVSFDLVKQDTSYLTVNPVVNLRYYMDGMNYIRLFYDYRNSTVLGDAQSPGIPLHADVNTSIYGLGLLFQNLDYRFNPRRGISAVLNLGIGSRKLMDAESVANQVDGGLNTVTTRYSADGTVAGFLPAGRSFTFFMRNRSGWIRQDELFDNEMFRLGGINSIRGVEENSILASAYSFFTAEFRYLFEENSNAYLFIDGGYYTKNAVSGQTEDTPLGFGTGISLESRLGIFSINYALGREFGNPINISRAKIHLGYISRF